MVLDFVFLQHFSLLVLYKAVIYLSVIMIILKFKGTRCKVWELWYFGAVLLNLL
jgi:hypothetical protein